MAGDVIFENQSAFRTDFGVPAVVGRFAARGRANKYRMTGVTPVLAAGHLFTNRTFFHQNTSKTPFMPFAERPSMSARESLYYQDNHYMEFFPVRAA